jgi:uncharacterized protein YuzE
VKLADFLLQFTAELREILRAAGEVDIAAQLGSAEVISCSYDAECEAGYIKLESAQTLNVVELNVITVRHGRTIPVEHPYWVNVDTDNFNRVIGIEPLDAPGLAIKLTAYNRGLTGS